MKKLLHIFIILFAITPLINDANKRTGFIVTFVFLEVNNAKQAFQKEDLENLVIEVAKGKET
jgi:prophage maintenance system killer protein